MLYVTFADVVPELVNSSEMFRLPAIDAPETLGSEVEVHSHISPVFTEISTPKYVHKNTDSKIGSRKKPKLKMIFVIPVRIAVKLGAISMQLTIIPTRLAIARLAAAVEIIEMSL